jgi:hypothetical protein
LYSVFQSVMVILASTRSSNWFMFRHSPPQAGGPPPAAIVERFDISGLPRLTGRNEVDAEFVFAELVQGVGNELWAVICAQHQRSSFDGHDGLQLGHETFSGDGPFGDME